MGKHGIWGLVASRTSKRATRTLIEAADGSPDRDRLFPSTLGLDLLDPATWRLLAETGDWPILAVAPASATATAPDRFESIAA